MITVTTEDIQKAIGLQKMQYLTNTDGITDMKEVDKKNLDTAIQNGITETNQYLVNTGIALDSSFAKIVALDFIIGFLYQQHGDLTEAAMYFEQGQKRINLSKKTIQTPPVKTVEKGIYVGKNPIVADKWSKIVYGE